MADVGVIDARAAMEALNASAAQHQIWLRTQANAPAQLPWFRDGRVDEGGEVSAGRVGAGQLKAVPHHWRWREIEPFLRKIASISRNADVPPSTFADRQQFLLTNPGLGGRLQVASTIRCAVSIYNPGDVAPVHVHTPNASRTILSEGGGYTTVEGERFPARRGDVILTPNGTWHDHGNDSDEPVMWIDFLDWPLLEFLDAIWLEDRFDGPKLGNASAQQPTLPAGYSRRIYGSAGLVPRLRTHQRGFGQRTSPMFVYEGELIRSALDGLPDTALDPYEGYAIGFLNPVDGSDLFPTLQYGAQRIPAGFETQHKRETSSTVYVVIAGSGTTEVGGRTFDWSENDIFVVPNYVWRRHTASPAADAVLYTVGDAALMQAIGQYRAQGRPRGQAVLELA